MNALFCFLLLCNSKKCTYFPSECCNYDKRNNQLWRFNRFAPNIAELTNENLHFGPNFIIHWKCESTIFWSAKQQRLRVWTYDKQYIWCIWEPNEAKSLWNCYCAYLTAISKAKQYAIMQSLAKFGIWMTLIVRPVSLLLLDDSYRLWWNVCFVLISRSRLSRSTFELNCNNRLLTA